MHHIFGTYRMQIIDQVYIAKEMLLLWMTPTITVKIIIVWCKKNLLEGCSCLSMQLSLRLAWMKNLKIITFTNQYVRRSHREYIQVCLNIYIGPQFGILSYYIFSI